MIPMDMHLHSNYSDGKNSIEEMVCASIALGLKRICFTDHVWKTSEWLDAYFDEIDRCRIKYESKIDVMGGVEAKLLNTDGELDVANDVYDRRVRIVGAMHRIPIGNGQYIRKSDIKSDLEAAKQMWIVAFRSFEKNIQMSCIAHPFSLLESMDITKDDHEWWRSISRIVDNLSSDLEYNVKYNNDIVPKWFWERHKNKIVFASDSHSIEDLVLRYHELKLLQV
jgi:putative hydrolase